MHQGRVTSHEVRALLPPSVLNVFLDDVVSEPDERAAQTSRSEGRVMPKRLAIGTRVVCLVVNETITGLVESEALIIGYEKDELSKYLGEFAVVELPIGERCNIHPSHVIRAVDARRGKGGGR